MYTPRFYNILLQGFEKLINEKSARNPDDGERNEIPNKTSSTITFEEPFCFYVSILCTYFYSKGCY